MSARNIEEAWLALGLNGDLINACRLPRQHEPPELSSIGLDMFDRELMATPYTVSMWHQMQARAEHDGVILQLVSAYRSIDYQCGLIQRKLDRGIPIEEIITVNAIPGFSEHHTGRALDINTPGSEPLETNFEESEAFAWLQENAERFEFSMSYPRDNPYGIDYEPWHWACVK